MYKYADGNGIKFTPDALDKYKKTNEGKKYFDTPSAGELLIGGGSALAGGAIGYLLSKNFSPKASAATRLVHSLLGAGVGGGGAALAMHTIKDADTGMSIADKFRSARIKEPSKFLAQLIEDNPHPDDVSMLPTIAKYTANTVVPMVGYRVGSEVVKRNSGTGSWIDRQANASADSAIEALKAKKDKLKLASMIQKNSRNRIDKAKSEQIINQASRTFGEKVVDTTKQLLGKNPTPRNIWNVNGNTGEITLKPEVAAAIRDSKIRSYKSRAKAAGKITGLAAFTGLTYLGNKAYSAGQAWLERVKQGK